MAKGNLFLGHARGRVGSIVFSRAYGKQITRTYAEQVANPKTLSQAIQRAVFATVTKTGSAIAEIVESSFDGFKNGSESRRAFVKENIALLRDMYNNEENVVLIPKGTQIQVPNRLLVSKGSLGNVTCEVGESVASDGYSEDYANVIGLKGEMINNVPCITLANLKDFNSNIKAGTQLTFLIYDIKDGSNNVLDGKWKYMRFVLSPTAKDDDIIISGDDLMAATIVKNLTEGLPSPTEDGLIDISSFVGAFKLVDDNPIVRLIFSSELGAAMIISNYNTNKGEWVHSTSYATTLYTSPFDIDAIPTYMAAASTSASSDYYTEQAIDDDGYVYYESINQAVSGTIRVQGYQPKTLNLESSNSYGPVTEKSTVDVILTPMTGVAIPTNSVKALVGETSVTAFVRRIGEYTLVSVDLPETSSSTQTLNITFKVNGGYAFSDNDQTFGVRTTIAITQA